MLEKEGQVLKEKGMGARPPRRPQWLSPAPKEPQL